MFTPTSALIVTLVAIWIFVLCQETLELNVTVKAGEDATLQCRSPGGADIKYIEWNRTDLKSDLYVFLFRNGRSNEKDQHPSFRGRVELRDPEMKDGDASVILKNVNINDTGTYECLVREENKKGKPELINTIRLTVTEPGHTDGHVGLKVGLAVFAVVAIAVVGMIIYKKMQS